MKLAAAANPKADVAESPISSPAELAHRKAVDALMCEDAEPWITSCGYYGFFGDGDLDLVNLKMGASKTPGPNCPSTYGEATRTGARQLFGHMGMNGSRSTGGGGTDDDIVFIDMGSGVGKLVMQAYMELPRLSRAIGIELAPGRHQHALSAWMELEESARNVRHAREVSLPTPDASVELLFGDIFEADISKATHLYIASLCFTEQMMHQLASKLEEEGQHLQCVATLRAFPMEFQRKGILDRVSYKVVWKTFGMIQRLENVEMSWTEGGDTGADVMIYSKHQ